MWIEIVVMISKISSVGIVSVRAWVIRIIAWYE